MAPAIAPALFLCRQAIALNITRLVFARSALGPGEGLRPAAQRAIGEPACGKLPVGDGMRFSVAMASSIRALLLARPYPPPAGSFDCSIGRTADATIGLRSLFSRPTRCSMAARCWPIPASLPAWSFALFLRSVANAATPRIACQGERWLQPLLRRQ